MSAASECPVCHGPCVERGVCEQFDAGHHDEPPAFLCDHETCRELRRDDRCPDCDNGSVWNPEAKGQVSPCSRCGGSGRLQSV